MENHEIQSVLMNALSLQEVHVSGDGSHFQVIAVGEMFDGMSRVKKQQTVYGPLMEYIADNLSMPYRSKHIPRRNGRAIVNLTDFKLRVTCR